MGEAWEDSEAYALRYYGGIPPVGDTINEFPTIEELILQNADFGVTLSLEWATITSDISSLCNPHEYLLEVQNPPNEWDVANGPVQNVITYFQQNEKQRNTIELNTQKLEKLLLPSIE